MPILRVKVSATKSPGLTREISALLLELTTRILRKKPEVTAIVIDYVEPDSWLVGAACLASRASTVFISTSR